MKLKIRIVVINLDIAVPIISSTKSIGTKIIVESKFILPTMDVNTFGMWQFI